MFRTKEYFLTSCCPFFECGFCERPRCHFEHRKQTVEDIAARPVPGEATEEALRSMASETVATAVDKVYWTGDQPDEEALVRRVLESLKQRFPAHRSYFQVNEAPHYTPTPVARLSGHSSPDYMISCKKAKHEYANLMPSYSSAVQGKMPQQWSSTYTPPCPQQVPTSSSQCGNNLLSIHDTEVDQHKMALDEDLLTSLSRKDVLAVDSDDSSIEADLNVKKDECADTKLEVAHENNARHSHKVNRKLSTHRNNGASVGKKCDNITIDLTCPSPRNAAESSRNIFNPKIPKLPVMKKDSKESNTRIHDEHYCDSDSSLSDIEDILSEDAFACVKSSTVVSRSAVEGTDKLVQEQDWDPDVEESVAALHRSPIHKIKRVAHPDAAEKRPATHPLQKNRISVNATQVMVERWKAREQLAENTKPRVRITPVLNVSSLLKAKEELLLMQRKLSPAVAKPRDRDSLTNCLNENLLSSRPADKRKCSSLDSKSLPKRNVSTVAQSHGKNGRVAHMPHSGRTLIAPFVETKVPHTIRQKWLDKLVEVSFRLYNNVDVANEKAVAAEKEILGRMVSQKMYQSMAATAVFRLKKEAEGISKVSTCLTYRDRLVGKNVKTKPDDSVLYESLAKYILSEDELAKNGFPMPHPTVPDAAYILESARRRGVGSPSSEMQQCVFCRKEYDVDSNGYSVTQYDCEYHWGRVIYKRKPSDSCKAAYYSCCSRRSNERGCTSCRYHVTDTFDKSCLEGFVCTREARAGSMERGVYAVDCEMCYTTKGFELTRVSVVDCGLNVVYNTLVLPHNPILNYNTRFSGIREDDLSHCTTRLAHVQRDLLAMFDSKTILIGHSLGSDLTALRMLHSTVVDTSVVFPHKHGPPMKRALRNLSLDILSKLIQDQHSGHDSAQDANTCMQLMLWKTKQDAAKANRTKKGLEQYLTDKS